MYLALKINIPTMSKICQCRRSKLLDRLWDIPDPYEDLVNQQLEDVEKILESDCVCEKKEGGHHLDTHCLFCDKDLPAGQDGGYCIGCITILKENAEKEKQSQSPCEKWNHSLTENKLEGRTPSLHKLPSGEYVYVKQQVTLWTCRECGLVTSLDPKGSGPSKNSNDK